MKSFDYVCPFVQSTSSSSIKASFDFAFDLTAAIIKLFFETKGKIEKKLGDLTNIAVAYWPFYIVPINNNNSYIIEAKNSYEQKVKTRVDSSKLPSLLQDVDEADVDRLVKSLEKHVSKVESHHKFNMEEKSISGFIPPDAFLNYFIHLFKRVQEPYLDSFYPVSPELSESAVQFIHDDLLNIFDDTALEWARDDLAEFEKLCNKWIGKIETLIENQESDPIESLKKKGQWNFPILVEGIDATAASMKEMFSKIRGMAKQENLKETIILTDRSINSTDDIKKTLEDYRDALDQLERQIRHEADEIEAQRKAWEDAIADLRDLLERERNAVQDFEESEKLRRSKFISEHTFAFKTSKVVLCGVPVFLLNFMDKKGRMTTEVRTPVILEEVSLFHKNPFKEPKGFSEFEKLVSNWMLKSQNEYEVQSNIKSQDLFSLPNLSIEVSKGIDEFRDMGYLDKKKHSKIRDDELHHLLKKG
ncbi:hypothetical protein GF325_08360 [Candidatus Bathyarchaeota archaeon]|nr:hypothetical protein [Candidatus Bathyarchaeota archaeon]